MAALPTKYAMARHVVVDCPLLKIPRHVLEQVLVGVGSGCGQWVWALIGTSTTCTQDNIHDPLVLHL